MATRRILWSGSITLPSPTKLTTNDEIIWASNSGRVMDGTMVGDVISEKKNVSISWGVLTEAELQKIKQVMIAGFFPISFRDDGVDITIQSYRGTLQKEHLGYIGDGVYYYKSASVTIVQK